MARVDARMIGRLVELRMPGHPDPVVEVLEIFASDGAAVVERILAAYARGDAEELRRAAHRLKGAAANVGAAELSSLCDAAERSARVGDLEGAEASVARIRVVFHDSVSALLAFSATTAPAIPSA